ncbi:MAG: protein translocase subunit SecD, partial [Sphaerotilus sp.]|nr:protein translocase subunit SecD [Sphaerotilus sp.]
MNRYPWWKYLILAIAVVVGLLYTLPNFFGEAPAVQVSSARATLKIDAGLVPKVEQAVRSAGLKPDFVQLEGTSVRARLADTDAQLKARDAIVKALNPDPADPSYIVALNLVSRSPQWLTSLHALPMYLGLDLRGGVHFLMQVDMAAALTKKTESLSTDVRTLLRDKSIRHSGIQRSGDAVEVRLRDRETLDKARLALSDAQPA